MPGLEATSSALQAEKMRLDIIGQNIANAQTTSGPDGKPYARQVVSFEAKLMEMGTSNGETTKGYGVGIRSITEDTSKGPLVYNPGHPDADDQGMVRLPNVNITHEMVDLIATSRAYEANLQVVRTAKQLASHALKMGK